MEKAELKPCPFCGSKVISTVGIPVDGEQPPFYGYFCRCDNCKSTGPRDKSIAEARYSWNLREIVMELKVSRKYTLENISAQQFKLIFEGINDIDKSHATWEESIALSDLIGKMKGEYEQLMEAK